MRRSFFALSMLPAIFGIAAPAAATAPAPAIAAPLGGGLTVAGPAGSTTFSPAAVARLPIVRLTLSFKTDHGALNAVFAGPLLWTVLNAAHATDPHQAARQVVTVTGADGYSAVLAVAEAAPNFEGKQVILATQMNGKPLGSTHLRLVVPGDRYGARSVRDVVRIFVSAAAPQ